MNNATRTSSTIAERLWSRVVTRPNGCQEWTGSLTPKGYGKIGRGHRGLGMMLTHRLAWELTNGPILNGMCVLHSCDNPPCCNVAHLWLGTKADNNRDMAAKGRTGSQRKTHCVHGHEFTPVNTFMDTKGFRVCRRCSADRSKVRYYVIHPKLSV